jgi:hypothetical protein
MDRFVLLFVQPSSGLDTSGALCVAVSWLAGWRQKLGPWNGPFCSSFRSAEQRAGHWALEPPYSGPYRVLSWRVKTLQLLVCWRPVTVSTDRVKPAYTLNGTDRGSNFNLPAAVFFAAAWFSLWQWLSAGDRAFYRGPLAEWSPSRAVSRVGGVAATDERWQCWRSLAEPDAKLLIWQTFTCR